MATYRFHVNMSIYDVIEVEADSYDEAYELAHVEASNGYSVLTPTGYMTFRLRIQDSYIPKDDE